MRTSTSTWVQPFSLYSSISSEQRMRECFPCSLICTPHVNINIYVYLSTVELNYDHPKNSFIRHTHTDIYPIILFSWPSDARKPIPKSCSVHLVDAIWSHHYATAEANWPCACIIYNNIVPEQNGITVYIVCRYIYLSQRLVALRKSKTPTGLLVLLLHRCNLQSVTYLPNIVYYYYYILWCDNIVH